jgi:hypothetical protein
MIPAEAEKRHVLRQVNDHGRISLLGFEYHVGRYLMGATVDVEIGGDRLLGVYHRGVLVATHARRHLPDKEPASWRTPPRVRVVHAKTPKITVIRKVDTTGSVSFAGTGYRVGNEHIGSSLAAGGHGAGQIERQDPAHARGPARQTEGAGRFRQSRRSPEKTEGLLVQMRLTHSMERRRV